MKSARLLRRLRKQIKRSQTHILLAAALAALGACAPLAEVSKTEPKLGAQDGTIAELRRAEQAIADAQKLKRTDPNRAVGFYLCGLEAAANYGNTRAIGWLCVITTSPYPACFRQFETLTSTLGRVRYTCRHLMAANMFSPSAQLRTGSGNHRNST